MTTQLNDPKILKEKPKKKHFYWLLHDPLDFRIVFNRIRKEKKR